MPDEKIRLVRSYVLRASVFKAVGNVVVLVLPGGHVAAELETDHGFQEGEQVELVLRRCRD